MGSSHVKKNKRLPVSLWTSATPHAYANSKLQGYNTLIPVNILRLSQTIINVVNSEGKPKAIVPTGAGVLQPPPALPRCAHACAWLLARLLPLLLLTLPGAVRRSECQAHVAAVALQMKQCDRWKISTDAGCLAVLVNAGAACSCSAAEGGRNRAPWQ